jgi:PAS domain S-box-containing protein
VLTSDGLYFHATVRDVTERRLEEAQQARREEQQRSALRDTLQGMRQAERTAHIGHWRHDVRSGVLEPSEELLRIVGAPPGARPEDAEAFVHPDDRAERRRVFQEVLAGKPYAHHEWRAVRPDGTIRYLSGAAEPVFDDAGDVTAVIGVTQDVTERTEALLAAQESSDQYRALIENMLEGFAYCRMVYDEKGLPDDFVYLGVNPAFSRLTGLRDVVGKRVTELIPAIKETNPEVLDIYGAVAATGEPAEFDVDFAPIGKWLHVSATRPREGEFVAFFYDVTERKEAERLAGESERRLHLSLAAADAGTWEWDLGTGENTWSDELWSLYGLERDGREPSYDAWLESVRPDDRAAVQRQLSAAVAEGRELNLEWRVTTRAGSIRWLLSRGSPERDAAGTIVRYRGVVVDVTERRVALDALRESEQRYSAIFNESPFAILLSRFGDAKVVGANRAFLELFQCDLDDVLGQTIPDLGIESPEAIAELAGELREHGSVRDHEVTRQTPSGGSVTLSVNLTSVSIGRQDHVLTVIRDISEARRAEHALNESRAKLDAAMASMTDAVLISDVDGNFLDFNDAFAAFHRFADKDECRRSLAGYPDIIDVYLASGERAPLEQWAVPRALRGEVVVDAEYGLRRKDTGETWVGSYSFGPIRDEAGDIVGSVVVARDVTDRRRMEQDLRRSEAEARETVARLSRAQQLGRMGDWEWDVAAGTVRWSEELYRIYGVGPDFETTFETIVKMTHPEDYEGNLRDAQAIIDDPDHSPGALSFRIVRPDGGVRHIFQTIAVERDTDGRATRAFGIMQDVTELREAEMAQVHSEQRLRRLYDAGLVGVVFWTAEGAITGANDRFLEMLGYTREDLEAGQVDWAAMTPPEWAARDQEGLLELRTTGRNAAPFEKEYYRKDGTRLPILVTAATLEDEGGHGVALILDISDQKRAESDLRRLNVHLEEHVRRRTADLEAANAELESFSYSVSHDLRAPLRHISGFSQLLADHVGKGDAETQHFVDVITRSAADMGTLIDDLLEFSRVGRAEMHLEQVDMEQLVREVLQVLQDELGDRRVDVAVGAVPPAVGDRTLLRQVWANLIGNAYKYTRPRDQALVEIGSSDGPGEIVYWVRDNGVGFDMQYADRLFRVFERLHRSEEFEGSGIGLANVQRIVGRHGGRCWVEADEGEGAMFFFALPAGTTKQ